MGKTKKLKPPKAEVTVQMSKEQIQSSLEAEFCPPLDSSLLAAMLSDYDLTVESLQILRSGLQELASCALAETTENDAPTSIGSALSTPSASVTSPSTIASATESTSTFEFLQMAFPSLPSSAFRQALEDVASNQVDGDDPEATPHDLVDMELVVQWLLNEEYVREIQEKGFVDSDNETEEPLWQTVPKHSQKRPKPKPGRAKAVPLIDIRQRQHLPPPPLQSSPTTQNPPDPWTYLSSLASFLTTIFPAHSPQHFLSLFHAPSSVSPAQALRQFLAACGAASRDEDFDRQLIDLTEILQSDGASGHNSSIPSESYPDDVLLCLKATCGRPEDAMDLVFLLRDLDSEPPVVLHFPIPPQSPKTASPSVIISDASPSAKVTPQQSALPMRPLKPPEELGWKLVAPRRPHVPSVHPLAESILAYRYHAWKESHAGSGSRTRTIADGNGSGMGRMRSVRSKEANLGVGVSDLRQTQDEWRSKRYEALMEASRQWRRHRGRGHGAEIAFHYTQEARGFQEESARWGLKAARLMVSNKQAQATDPRDRDRTTLDLHGLTVKEAVIIVKETLSINRPCPGSPVRIITGQGNHSHRRIGVLGPEIKKVLDNDGWNVTKWDGGLSVWGRL